MMAKHELLKARLREWKELGRIVSFCPWGDLDGLLCGRIVEIGETTVTFDEIDPYGQPDGQTVCRFANLQYVEQLTDYGDRLERLKDFKPTLSEDKSWVAKRSEVRRMVTEASKTQEIVDVRFKDDDRITVQVLEFDGKWLRIRIYGESIRTSHEATYRIGALRSISWRNRSTEADEYLLKGDS